MTREEVEQTFQITYLEELEFSSPEILAKIEKRCEKKLKNKNHAQFNHWTNSLFHSSILQKKEAPFVIRKVNPLVGYGVFAKERIPYLSYVGEYTGVVRKRRRRKDETNDYVFGYVIGPDDTPWVIDAREKGNFTRFINHSDTPNLTSRWIIVEGRAHIILFANSLIEKGEQLTYDYGPYYWRRRSQPQIL